MFNITDVNGNFFVKLSIDDIKIFIAHYAIHTYLINLFY